MATATPAKTAPVTTSGPPAGYDDVGRPEIDGWAKPADGFVLYGRICGFFAFDQIVKDKTAPGGFVTRKREALCLKVYGNETRAFSKGDKTGFVLKEGQVIAISMMYALEGVRPYIQKRGKVWVKFLFKKDIGNGQEVWKVEGPKCQGEITAAVKAAYASVDDSGDPGDESVTSDPADNGEPF